MSLTNAIDLSKLPEFEFIEQLSIDDITADALQWLTAQDGVEAPLDPGDPSYREIRSAAYRERILRRALEDAFRNTSLLYAEKDALDHIGVTYHRTPRLPGEQDKQYRQRIALSPEGKSVAGPKNSYIFHAKSASPLVADVTFMSPLENEVVLTVLSSEGDGIPTQELLDTVVQAVNPSDVRAQGDRVTIQAATLLNYSINATLILRSSVDNALVVEAARQATIQYYQEQKYLGGWVVDSGIKKHLHQVGVVDVELHDWQNVKANSEQAPNCTAFNLVTEVLNDD